MHESPLLERSRDGYRNATQAAIRAGYSRKTAASIGHENLTKPEIFAAVQQALARHLEQLDLSFDGLVQEAARVGISNIQDFFDEQGHLLPLNDIPPDAASAIASVKITRRGRGEQEVTVTEVRLWPKLQALELIGKLKNLLNHKVAVEAGDTWKDVLHEMLAARSASDEN